MSKVSQDHAPHTGSVTSGQSHTQGPWKVWSSMYEGMAAAIVRDVEPLETLAEVRKYSNARLIAASPALYEALKNASGLLDVPVARRRHKGDPFYEEVVESIRQALALVEGE